MKLKRSEPKNMNGLTIAGLALFIIFASHLNVCADQTGEIININSKYHIVFTGLSSTVLRQGDIVKVFVDEDSFIYMEAVEVSPILSKLEPVNRNGTKTDMAQFDKLAIGNKVVKLSEEASSSTVFPATQPQSVQSAPSSIEKQAQSSAPNASDSQQLNNSLRLANENIKALQDKNLGLSQEASRLAIENETLRKEKEQQATQIKNLNAVLEGLKTKLDNMNTILGNNAK